MKTQPVSNLLWRERLDFVLGWARVCPACGSLRPPIDLLCESCWKRLTFVLDHGAGTVRGGYPFPVRSLLTWSEENDSLVRALLYGFKGGWSVRAARRLAERLSSECIDGAGDRRPTFVHPPSSSGLRDHSWLLAQCLSDLWKAPAITLKAASLQAEHANQKRLRAAERAERRLELPNSASFSRRNQSWIFIDDVLTTGSTAMAAYMALGDPISFEAWTLVCRPKLAGISRV